MVAKKPPFGNFARSDSRTEWKKGGFMLQQEINSYVSWRVERGQTITNRYSLLWRLDKFCGKNVWEITSSDIAKFQKSLAPRYSMKDINHIMGVVHDFMGYCNNLFYMNGKILWHVDVLPEKRTKGGVYAPR